MGEAYDTGCSVTCTGDRMDVEKDPKGQRDRESRISRWGRRICRGEGELSERRDRRWI